MRKVLSNVSTAPRDAALALAGEKNIENYDFKEIISNNAGACLQSDCYKENGVMLIENTPEEICDVALEMVNKLTGSWKQASIDSTLQSKFWDIFPNTKPIKGEIIHGEIRLQLVLPKSCELSTKQAGMLSQ